MNGEWTAIGNNSSNNNTTQFTGSFDGNSKTITNLTINKPSADYQGLFGYIGVNGAVKNLMLNNSNVRGKNYAGGVAGYNYGTVEKCYVTGNISGDDYAGGVAGGNRGTVEHCCATGDVSGKTYIGGVAGQNSGTVEYCYATGNIKGNDSGGVVGSNNSTVKNCYATGIVSENGGNRGVSGIVGNSTGGILENCVALSPNININGMTYYNERVLGYDSNTLLPTILTNNYARKDMLYNNATVAWASNPSDRHGTDITAVEYNSRSWWSDAAPNGPGFDFTATGAWEWHSANQLPILKGFTPGTQNPQ